MIEIYSELINNIADEIGKDYIDGYREELLNYIGTESFNYSLKKLIYNNQYDCISLLGLFYPIYKKYWNSSSDNEILKYIFDWVLSLSFPGKVNRKFDKKLEPLILFYLNLLRNLSKYEAEYSEDNPDNMFNLQFLTEEEEKESNYMDEYLKFKKIFIDNWIYELMKLDFVLTGHNTLDHVMGVNNLSLYIGRQLKKFNLPVDLGIVVGAALGHDIGKYGVRDEDIKRVPYLHYYYTEEWFNRFGLYKIGHIATNHSTWDLELENLPIESLILIYSDFRIKNKDEKMHIFTLDESYDVILNKLDNVDEIKKKRYEKVYKKLKDFEDYIIDLGVDTTLKSGPILSKYKKPFSLMDGNEIVDNIKYFAIEHNIDLMAKLSDDTGFNNILDMARNETNYTKIRLYLQMFREYCTYLTQSQKVAALNYFRDLLLHKEDDVRREASELIGLLISRYDEEYRKEIPKESKPDTSKLTSEKILDKIIRNLLYPNPQLIESIKEWQYNLQNIIRSLFDNCREEHCIKYAKVLIKYYDDFKSFSSHGQLYLCQTLSYIPIQHLKDEDLDKIHDYIINQLNSDIPEVRLAILDILNEMFDSITKINNLDQDLKQWVLKNLNSSFYASENYLKYKIAVKLNMNKEIVERLKFNYKENEENPSEIFLKNLKTATQWIDKKINVDILYEQVKKSPKTVGFHVGMHFCNLLKVSAAEKVRNHAGATLLKIFDLLSLEQRNDIVVELLRALEMENYQFTKFIPEYLGQLLLYLHPKELDEAIDDFEEKIKQSSSQVVSLLLITIGIAVENYPSYIARFNEDEKKNEDRLIRLLSIILNGMVTFEEEIKAEAFRIIGSLIFNSNKLNLKQKLKIFKVIAKKILTLLPNKEDSEFIFLSNSASLNHIYRFILDYEINYGSIQLDINKKVAFFPGSFDPFSLSHKKIALEIRDLGFEVYLAVDEFSWSKRVQPHKLRKNIISMTIAYEKDIYLFPSEIPININNDKDLEKLKSLFNNKEVYIVVGSDVIANASAYTKDGLLNSFPHIVFDRKTIVSKDEDREIVEDKLQKIKGKVLRLTLPPQYEDISSSKIRRAIDLNMDISKEMDPLALRYIYKYGLYYNEPRYKSVIQTKAIDLGIVKTIDDNIINTLINNFKEDVDINAIIQLKDKLEPTILIVKEAKENKIIGFSTFYCIKNYMLYEEFKDTSITNYLRDKLNGKIAFISGIYVQNKDNHSVEIVLNETLAQCLIMDCNHAIYCNKLTYKNKELIEKNIIIQGFIETPFKIKENSLFIVNMSNPITLSLDLETLLKPPFDNSSAINTEIDRTREKLKDAISKLYPGELVIVFNRDMIYSKLIQKICDINQVPTVQDQNRVLGPNMCVPFGSILNGRILPNTITKSLHSEKIFYPNIKGFTIGAFPNYLSLEDQAKTLASFNRPIILVDDLLHKGYRLNVIEPILKNNNIEIKKLVVGILTGRGKELGAIKNLELDSAYFVPNLKLWFNENLQYPFIGGDAVLREEYNQDYLIPSINLILPYVFPAFIKNTSIKAIYNLSEVCLTNAIDLFKAIEKVYQRINGRNLVIRNLGHVVISPRRPDTLNSTEIIRNCKPSDYLMQNLEQLKRVENALNRI